MGRWRSPRGTVVVVPVCPPGYVSADPTPVPVEVPARGTSLTVKRKPGRPRKTPAA